MGSGLRPFFFTPTLHGNWWRRLRVTVSQDAMEVGWEEEPSARVSYQDLLPKANVLSLTGTAPLAVPAAYGPRGGLGLFVSRGAAAFEEVVVEPLAAP
jgi:hypothetical protein